MALVGDFLCQAVWIRKNTVLLSAFGVAAFRVFLFREYELQQAGKRKKNNEHGCKGTSCKERPELCRELIRADDSEQSACSHKDQARRKYGNCRVRDTFPYRAFCIHRFLKFKEPVRCKDRIVYRRSEKNGADHQISAIKKPVSL